MSCILGIKSNGLSVSIGTLNIDTDQTPYDYICNVTLANEDNGNGKYDITIIDKNLRQGFPMSDWKIAKAWIEFDWGNSIAWFIMSDSRNDQTIPIMASCQGGSRSESRGYFDTDTLTRTIFTKAQKVLLEYPSASIYNAIMDFEEERKKYQWEYLRDTYKKVLTDSDRMIEILEKAISYIKVFLDKYNNVKHLLEESEDPRSAQLLPTITKECEELLLSLRQ